MVKPHREMDKASQLLYIGFTTGQKVDVPLLSLSCLGAKDTMQSLWEMLVGLLKKHCCHIKRCGFLGGAAV